MTLYAFHPNDLTVNAPRVLPAPLVCGAVFLNGSYPTSADVGAFLTCHGVDIARVGRVWFVFVVNAATNGETIAQAAFGWHGQDTTLLAMEYETTPMSTSITDFLLQTGSGLFGGAARSGSYRSQRPCNR